MGDINFANMSEKYWHIGLVAIFLVAFTLDFLFRFVFQSMKLSRELKKSLVALRAIRTNMSGDIVELGEIEAAAMSGPALNHLWREYCKTLHPQSADDGLGQLRVTRWRATALAENFFSEQAVIDRRLKTEFFKHLPGVLTGLGIIGTFLGLIRGLIDFDVSLEPTKAQEQLRNLVNSVGHAFFVSAAAIGLAMLFTWIEKSSVTARCRQVEELRELIDSLFKGGAGEEYLERLVVSSENSATQSAQIKDALVVELKEILTTLTTRQIEAQANTAGQMSVDVGKAIKDSLGPSMEAITKAVQGVSASQGDAVNKMLTDVLASFSAQMREMFGGQMSGMTDMMLRASEAMQETAIEFSKLAANMDAAGTNTVDAMGERLTEALEAMDARQGLMNDRMKEFVEQIRALVSESQTESSEKLKSALAAVSDQIVAVVEHLKKQAELAEESQGERHARFERTTGEVIGSLSVQVEQLLAQSMEANKSLQNTVANLAQASGKAISELNSGADTLYAAATEFAKAGQGVSETMRSSVTAAEALKTSSSLLTTSTDGAKAIIADYAKTRDTFAMMISELKATLDNAKREASLTAEIIGQFESAAEQLAVAQKGAEEYLRGVSDVLVEAHESFQANVERTLREGNRQFQDELSGAVQLLSGAIKNLGDVVDDIPARV